MTEEQFDEKYKEILDAEAERFMGMITNSINVRLPEPRKWWQLWRSTPMMGEYN
jgi:hypothetical protein